MKIKILSPLGTVHKIGDVVEAIINPSNTDSAYAYDASGLLWNYYKPYFEEAFEDPQPMQSVTTTETSFMNSLRDLVGQDMARIEFK